VKGEAMSVRKRKWVDKQGQTQEKWMIHVEHTWPDGRRQTIRKVSPVQTKRGAEQYEREVRKLLVSGQWEEADRPKTPTLEEFADEFLAYQATVNKPQVVDDKRVLLRVHLMPAFGKLGLDQIDTRAIDAYKVEKLGLGKEPQTINQHLKLLGRVLRVARKWKLIKELPEFGLLKARKTGFDFLTFDECERFLAAAREHVPDWYPYMLVAARTGLRVGEMLALRWREDIDLERGRLRVQQSHHRKHGISTTKNGKCRELPLTWDAKEALAAQRTRAPGDLVFPMLDVKAKDTMVNHWLDKACEHAGLRRIHNHVLRHTFASHAIMRGVPIRQVQEWLGHGSVIETMRYTHLAEGHGDELIKLLAPEPIRETVGPTKKRAASPRHTSSTQHTAHAQTRPQPG